MKHSYPTLEPLKFLLDMINNRTMALPDFQRDFVWDPHATDELVESIINNYPAGTLLRIKTGKQLPFQPRAFEGAPILDGATPAYLVLDGQQRLTSLYQAFYGKGDHCYFLNLRDLDKDMDLEDCAFFLTRNDAKKHYETIEQQAKSLMFPLERVFGTYGGFSGWQNQILKTLPQDKLLTELQRLTRLHEKWISPIEAYDFPMVTLNEETPGPAVCMIFETLNRTGVRLSVFDLLTARFWPLEFKLRDKWEQARDEYPILSDYKVDPYYVLQIVALLEPGIDKDGQVRAPSVKRNAVLDMQVGQINRGWDRAIEGLAAALVILRDDCGVLHPGLLPYNTIVIPMGAAWAAQLGITGAESGSNRLKVMRWFWCSVFGQKYENAPNSQAERDFDQLQKWMKGGAVPDSVGEYKCQLDLRQVKPSQRAVYRGIMALVLQNGALDFHKRGKITSLLLADKKNPVDDHHIFPRAYLDNAGKDKALRDCILNRTYIDRNTNKRLSKTPPSTYFKEMRQEHGSGPADETLRSHFLPDGNSSPLLNDDFEAFLDVRQGALMELIRIKTGDLA